mmetsp:Transcript_44052/g.72815  ORF Transcript_44052/g.72815 Transcript_44052/m.72815 type:complete len:486 (+) Transcript_44052:878-2335(+)
MFPLGFLVLVRRPIRMFLLVLGDNRRVGFRDLLLGHKLQNRDIISPAHFQQLEHQTNHNPCIAPQNGSLPRLCATNLIVPRLCAFRSRSVIVAVALKQERRVRRIEIVWRVARRPIHHAPTVIVHHDLVLILAHQLAWIALRERIIPVRVRAARKITRRREQPANNGQREYKIDRVAQPTEVHKILVEAVIKQIEKRVRAIPQRVVGATLHLRLIKLVRRVFAHLLVLGLSRAVARVNGPLQLVLGAFATLPRLSHIKATTIASCAAQRKQHQENHQHHRERRAAFLWRIVRVAYQRWRTRASVRLRVVDKHVVEQGGRVSTATRVNISATVAIIAVGVPRRFRRVHTAEKQVRVTGTIRLVRVDIDLAQHTLTATVGVEIIRARRGPAIETVQLDTFAAATVTVELEIGRRNRVRHIHRVTVATAHLLLLRVHSAIARHRQLRRIARHKHVRRVTGDITAEIQRDRGRVPRVQIGRVAALFFVA